MGTGKKKIEIKRKEKESDRMVTFSKRRKGLFRKAHQLHTLSGANIAVLVFSPAGKPYIYGDPSFDDIVNKYYYGTTTENTCAEAEVAKDSQEIELEKSWAETTDLDNLLVIKNELEEIRNKLIERIDDINQ